MIFVEYRNYNARGLIVKYVYFVLISILKIYLSLGSPLSEKSGHIYILNACRVLVCRDALELFTIS